VSLAYRLPFICRRFRLFIFVSGSANHRVTVRLEGLGQLKVTVTSSGIKPTTFRLVAHYLNHLSYWVLLCVYCSFWNRALSEFFVLWVCTPAYRFLLSLYEGVFVRFEVFIAVAMYNSVLYDVAPCGSCKNLHVGGNYNVLPPPSGWREPQG
jgi:hypothetical protein